MLNLILSAFLGSLMTLTLLAVGVWLFAGKLMARYKERQMETAMNSMGDLFAEVGEQDEEPLFEEEQ